jgi:hypothetical protein
MSRTILSEVNGWTPVIDSIATEYSPITALVFGVIWRYCQMDSHKCTASQQTLADHIGISRRAFMDHAKILVENGFLIAEESIGKTTTYYDTGKAGVRIILAGDVQESDNQPTQEMRTNKTINNKTSNTHGDALSKTHPRAYFYPASVRDVVEIFAEVFKIKPPWKADAAYPFWIKGARGLMQAIGDRDARAVIEAVREDQQKRGYTVTSPKSIANMARAIDAKPVTRERYRLPDGKYYWVYSDGREELIEDG